MSALDWVLVKQIFIGIFIFCVSIWAFVVTGRDIYRSAKEDEKGGKHG